MRSRSSDPPRAVGHTCPTINHLQKRARKRDDLESVRLLERLREEVVALRERLVWFEEEVDRLR